MTRTWEGTERIEISASPEAVWQIVTDLSRHPQLAGSGEVKSIRQQGPLRAGGSWEADERVLGQSFTARSQCLELDAPQRFVWRSFPPPMRKGRADSVPDVTWSFAIRRVPGGCLVEHSFHVIAPATGGGMLAAVYAMTRRPRKIRAGMRKTLHNLKREAESAPKASDRGKGARRTA